MPHPIDKSFSEMVYTGISYRIRLWIVAVLLIPPLAILAADERNLLQKAADIHQLSQMLVPNQKWVTYPAYTGNPVEC